MHPDNDQNARPPDHAPAEPPAWVLDLMARYETVAWQPSGKYPEAPATPHDRGTIDAIMRYYNG